MRRVAILLTAYPAQNRAHPADQFARTKRLDQIIVGAQFQALNAVIFISASGEHENRSFGPGANAAADLKTVERRQHDVENHKVRMLARVQSQPIGPISGDDDGIPSVSQIEIEQVNNTFFILNNQD